MRSTIVLLALLATVVSSSSAQRDKARPPAERDTTPLAMPQDKPSPAPGRSASNVRESIKKLENERNEAISHSDTATLDRMTADDYTIIDLFGRLRTKSEIIQSFKSGAIKIPSRTIDDLIVRVYGNTAIVTGRVTQKGVADGKDTSGQYRFTRIYVRGKSGWQSVAAQETRVAQ